MKSSKGECEYFQGVYGNLTDEDYYQHKFIILVQRFDKSSSYVVVATLSSKSSTPEFKSNRLLHSQFSFSVNSKFSFNFETKNKVLAEIHNLDKKKSCQESDIPVKIIKDNIDIFSEFVLHNFNNSIFDATFPSELKRADVTPNFQKERPKQC